jgi:hypothetical protein
MNNTAEHTAKCLHCGRTRRFRSAEAANAAKPYGRICSARVRLAAMAEAVKGFAARQVEAARELIADGGLVPTKRHGVFLAVSSDGERTYLTHSETCACPSGLKRLTACTCKHSLAVRIIMASRPALAA